MRLSHDNSTYCFLYPQAVEEFRNFLSLIGRNLVAGPEISLYMTGQIHSTSQLDVETEGVQTWKPIMREPSTS